MEPAEALTDGPVRLRRWRSDDVADLHEAVNDSLEHLTPFMPWAVGGYSEADAASFLALAHTEWRDGTAFSYAILGAADTVAGCGSIMRRIGEGGLEIGYWLADDATGHGVATRAAALLTAEAFRVGARFVEIHHDPANVRSGLIPRRLGFTRVGRVVTTRPGGTAGTGELVVWRRSAGGCA
ncbi:MAG TPA: GNAT family N-acetyltransferase [Amycolatopsis sp.]|nr:GNAT family N-acetyltransferase [Amycolatopsis sp.]